VSGSYSILAPVHPRFQLLVCIKASDVKQMPLPFLNRSLDCQGTKFKLERFFDSLVYILDLFAGSKSPNQKKMFISNMNFRKDHLVHAVWMLL
jgi:hypothetical protein